MLLSVKILRCLVLGNNDRNEETACLIASYSSSFICRSFSDSFHLPLIVRSFVDAPQPSLLASVKIVKSTSGVGCKEAMASNILSLHHMMSFDTSGVIVQGFSKFTLASLNAIILFFPRYQ